MKFLAYFVLTVHLCASPPKDETTFSKIEQSPHLVFEIIKDSFTIERKSDELVNYFESLCVHFPQHKYEFFQCFVANCPEQLKEFQKIMDKFEPKYVEVEDSKSSKSAKSSKCILPTLDYPNPLDIIMKFPPISKIPPVINIPPVTKVNP